MARDGQVLRLVEGMKRQPQPETLGEGNLFLDRLAGMDLAIQDPRVTIVGHRLRHQVTAIGRRHNQDVVGRRGHRSFQNRFQMLVARLFVGKREIIAKQKAALRPTIQQRQQIRQLSELGLADLDQTQTLIGISARQRLDERGFASPARAPEQHIVGRPAGDELADIAFQRGALAFKPQQIFERSSPVVHHGLQHPPSLAGATPAPDRCLREIDGHEDRRQPVLQPIGQPFQSLDQVPPLRLRHRHRLGPSRAANPAIPAG